MPAAVQTDKHVRIHGGIFDALEVIAVHLHGRGHAGHVEGAVVSAVTQAVSVFLANALQILVDRNCPSGSDGGILQSYVQIEVIGFQLFGCQTLYRLKSGIRQPAHMGGNRGEHVRIAGADGHRAAAAHGNAADTAHCRIGDRTVGGVGHIDDFLLDMRGPWSVVVIGAAFSVAVERVLPAVRHHDDHFHDVPGSNLGVHEVADVVNVQERSGRGVLSMEKIHNRIGLCCVCVIAGRQVDTVSGLFAQQRGLIGRAVAAVPVADLHRPSVNFAVGNLNAAGEERLFCPFHRSGNRTAAGIPEEAVFAFIEIGAFIFDLDVGRVRNQSLDFRNACILVRGVMMIVIPHSRRKSVHISGLNRCDLLFDHRVKLGIIDNVGGQAFYGTNGRSRAAEGVILAQVEAAVAVVVIQADRDLVDAAQIQHAAGNTVLALNFPV